MQMGARKETPFRIAYTVLIEALAAAGWTQLAPDDPRSVGGPYRYTDETSHRAVDDPQWMKEYRLPFGVSGTICHDRLLVHPALVVHQIYPGRGRGEFDPPIRLVTIEGPGHPHKRGQGDFVCYHSRTPATAIQVLPPEGVGAMLAALVTEFETTENPASIANDHWRACHGCKRLDYRLVGFACDNCDGFWCAKCATKKCQKCAGPIEAPDGVPPWAFVAQRFHWPPSTGQYRRALLIGCGVTGSWAALVLNRMFGAVSTVDPDLVAHPAIGTGDYINRAGVWGNPRRVGNPKAAAVERIETILNGVQERVQRREQAFVTRHQDPPGRHDAVSFGPDYLAPGGLDLAVLCVDTAGVRLRATPTLANRILDVRGTPGSCVFWALPGHPGAPRGMGRVVPEAYREEEAMPGAWANGHNRCLGCGGILQAGEMTLAWIDDGIGDHVYVHARCRPEYERPAAPAGPPLPATEVSLWDAWRASLERYLPTEAERCGDHHDAVGLAAGTTTAQFLVQWLSEGMPTGLWEVPFAIEGLTPLPKEAMVA